MRISTIVLSVLAVMLAVGFAGCKKKEQSSAATMKDMQKQATQTAEDTKKAAATTAEEAKKTATAAAAIEQTVCPVMEGNKIDKNVFVEYQGKKVYFCCADCKAKFLAEPQKYLAKLPQFAK
jgi:YHS domain-containing protein